jgi:hypothetical protein
MICLMTQLKAAAYISILSLKWSLGLGMGYYVGEL